MLKANPVGPFTCLYHDDQLVTDRGQIHTLLEESWQPIFPSILIYRNTFYSARSLYLTSHFPKLTLDDMHSVLTKKLKRNTATGTNGWRAHEFKSLPDCFLLTLLHVFHLSDNKVASPLPFISPTLFLSPGVPRVHHLAFGLLPFYRSHIEFTLAYDVKPFRNGKLNGFIPLNMPFAKDVAAKV